jgi:hypothetical protein
MNEIELVEGIRRDNTGLIKKKRLIFDIENEGINES